MKNIYLAKTKNALICPICNVLHQGYIQVRLTPESKETQDNIHLIVRVQSIEMRTFVLKKKKKTASSLYLILGSNFGICLKLVKNLQVLFIDIWARNQNHLCLNTIAILCTAQDSNIFC